MLIGNTIKFNTSLPTLSLYSNALGFVDRRKEEEKVHEIVKKLEVLYYDIKQPIATLSGGNQQKVAIGKWLAFPESKIFLFDEPTKGIDVGVKSKIYAMVAEMAQNGIGIVYISNEVEEILALSHRIIVLYDKEIIVEAKNEDITEEKLLTWSMGSTEQKIHNQRKID